MSRPIKIAFFADILVRGFDGAARTMFHIIDRFPDTIDVTYFCGQRPSEKESLNCYSFPTIPIPFNKTYKLAIPLGHKIKLYKLLDRINPDIIHISSPSPLGKVALAYAVEKGLPVITIYHTHFISYIEYYLKNLPFLIPIAKKSVIKAYLNFYNNCNLILLPTNEMITELDSYGIEKNRMAIWKRGIDHTIFHPMQVNKGYLRSMFKNEKPTIIFASRLVWEKNLKTLAKIYQKYSAQGHPYNYLIVGEGVAREALTKLMPKAIFTGEVDQTKLANLFAESDVFIFPSISETFGNVVAEAMACGCPCVIADGGGTPSHIDHGINGYLCPSEDVVQYMKYIDILISQPDHKKQIAKQALSYTANLDWDRLIFDYIHHLESFLSYSYPSKVAS